MTAEHVSDPAPDSLVIHPVRPADPALAGTATSEGGMDALLAALAKCEALVRAGRPRRQPVVVDDEFERRRG